MRRDVVSPTEVPAAQIMNKRYDMSDNLTLDIFSDYI